MVRGVRGPGISMVRGARGPGAGGSSVSVGTKAFQMPQMPQMDLEGLSKVSLKFV